MELVGLISTIAIFCGVFQSQPGFGATYIQKNGDMTDKKCGNAGQCRGCGDYGSKNVPAQCFDGKCTCYLFQNVGEVCYDDRNCETPRGNKTCAQMDSKKKYIYCDKSPNAETGECQCGNCGSTAYLCPKCKTGFNRQCKEHLCSCEPLGPGKCNTNKDCPICYKNNQNIESYCSRGNCNCRPKRCESQSDCFKCKLYPDNPNNCLVNKCINCGETFH